MRTVPDAIQDNARDGVFAYAVTISPNAGDSWSAYRWGQKALAIDGDTYAGGRLAGISGMASAARIESFGGIATRDAAKLTLINTDRYHEQFLANDIYGRKIEIALAPISFNRIKNSSFERYSGSDFENWTENTPGAGGLVGVYTADKNHGAASLFMTYAGTTPAPVIYSDEFTVKAGEYLTTSIDTKLLGGTGKFKIAIYIAGYYWQFGTRDLNAGIDWKEFAAPASWGRTEIESLHWSEFGLSSSLLSTTVKIYFMVDTSGDSVIFDCAQAEAHPEQRPYIPHPLDLLSSDVTTRYAGEVRNWKYNRAKISLDTISMLHRVHKKIPFKTITPEVDSSWNIPKESLGKPFPMTYGDLYVELEKTRYFIPPQELAFGRVCNAVEETSNPAAVYFDRPGMKLYSAGRLHHFVEQAGTYIMELYDDRTVPHYGTIFEWDKSADNGGKYTPNANAGYLPTGRFALTAYLYPNTVTANPKPTSGYGAWTNPENAADGDQATGATVVVSPAATHWHIVQFLAAPLVLPECELIYVFVLADATLVCSTTFPRLTIAVDRSDATENEGLAIISATTNGSFINAPWSTTPTLPETQMPFTRDAKKRLLSFWAGGSSDTILELWAKCASSASATYTVKEFGIRLDLTIPLISAVFAAPIKGREFQDTWSARKTSGNLIEEAHDVVEGVFRDELDAVTADINTTAFDAVNTLRASSDYDVKLAGQLLRLTDSDRALNDIARDGALLAYTDALGRHAVAALEWRTKDFDLDLVDFVRGSVEVGHTSNATIYNDINVSYARNGHTGDFSQAVYCNRGDSNFAAGADQTEYEGKCSSSYAALGNTENRLEYEAPWIQAKAEAEKLLKWLIDWNSQFRFVITGELFFDSIGLELGDVGELSLPGLLPASIAESSRFIVTSLKPNTKKNTFKIKLLEVKDPDA